MNYQRDYSSHFSAVKDESIRRQKAIKIVRALLDHLERKDLHGLTCLDAGCSVGVISHTLASSGAQVVGLDIDEAAIRQAASLDATGVTWVIGDVGATPLPDKAFDLVVCSQVYEHSPSLTLLAQEIHRLLKTGGVCFFSGPNRWAVMERHYGLPFLSWLPKRWADGWVRAAGQATEYYERPRTGRELRKALKGFIIYDLAPRLLMHPDRYAVESEVGRFKYLARCIPAWGWSILGELVPNFNWLLIKT